MRKQYTSELKRIIKAMKSDPVRAQHSLLVVPARASLVFEVSLELGYGFNGGLNIENKIDVDLSKNGNAVICPNLVVEVLTPLPGLVATQTQGGAVAEDP